MTVRECAFNHDFKLYRTGELFDLAKDPDENSPLEISSLEDVASMHVSKLQSVLDQFRNARPVELDAQFKQTSNPDKSARKKKKAAK